MDFEIKKTTFHTVDDYQNWVNEWRIGYKSIEQMIREHKAKAKEFYKAGDVINGNKLHNTAVTFLRPMASKMLDLRANAKEVWKKQMEGMKELQKVMNSYPIDFGSCREVVFHFNKAHNQNPNIPAWILKIKGESYYIHHLEATAPFTTKETPENSHTKGALKFKKVHAKIDENGIGYLITQ